MPEKRATPKNLKEKKLTQNQINSYAITILILICIAIKIST